MKYKDTIIIPEQNMSIDDFAFLPVSNIKIWGFVVF